MVDENDNVGRRKSPGIPLGCVHGVLALHRRSELRNARRDGGGRRAVDSGSQKLVGAMRRLIFHLCWILTVAQWPGSMVRPQGLTPTEWRIFSDPEIEDGDTCTDDDGSEVFTDTARG